MFKFEKKVHLNFGWFADAVKGEFPLNKLKQFGKIMRK